MKEARTEGVVSFVHHEKEYVTIEYTVNGRKKTINGKVDEATQLPLKEEKLIKKFHRFHEGDEVEFTITRSARGDKNIAERIVYRFNNALGNLINRAAVDNQFVGYLKLVDKSYFVKETGTYLFFPLIVSPWEVVPAESQLNEPVFFKLENTGNPEKVSAALLKPRYIPEFMTAKKYYTNKTVIEARVAKVTPHSVHVNVIGEKIMGKIPLEMPEGGHPEIPLPKVSDPIKIVITHLSPTRIVIARA
jgi:hypothetical protein